MNPIRMRYIAHIVDNRFPAADEAFESNWRIPEKYREGAISI